MTQIDLIFGLSALRLSSQSGFRKNKKKKVVLNFHEAEGDLQDTRFETRWSELVEQIRRFPDLKSQVRINLRLDIALPIRQQNSVAPSDPPCRLNANFMTAVCNTNKKSESEAGLL